MFKRRNPKTYLRWFADAIYPRGGWSRASTYVLYRLRRLRDPPHRIARGIAAGVFICFTPFYGLHFLLGAGIAFLMQGNVVAALLATFFGNPITFPFIAAIALELGGAMLGMEHTLSIPEVFESFRMASVQIWANFAAIFTAEVAQWDQLLRFFATVFWPYFVGGLVPGVFAGVAAYMLARPTVAAYQKARIKRLKRRYRKRRTAGLKKADRPGHP